MASRVAKPRVMPFGTSYPGFQPGGTSDATYEGTSAIFYNILNLRFEIFVIYHSFTTLFHHFYLKFQTIFTLSHWDFPQLVLMKESNSSAQRCRNINVAGLSPPPATKSLALSSFFVHCYWHGGQKDENCFFFDAKTSSLLFSFLSCAFLHNLLLPLIITRPIP